MLFDLQLRHIITQGPDRCAISPSVEAVEGRSRWDVLGDPTVGPQPRCCNALKGETHWPARSMSGLIYDLTSVLVPRECAEFFTGMIS